MSDVKYATVAPTATVLSAEPQATMVVQTTPATEPMMVTCPPNAGAGMPIQVINPQTGSAMQVVVPNGIGPGQQFQVMFPAPVAQVVPQPVVAQQVVITSNMRQCRGCGRPFELEPGQNPASAAAYRCKSCRGFSSLRFF